MKVIQLKSGLMVLHPPFFDSLQLRGSEKLKYNESLVLSGSGNCRDVLSLVSE